ncbi:MAG: DUF2238 domain-containing protein [Sedimentisphaerales bacterium]|nr:DUF2238 domain-containing protein [Sedimentisphaerales bacterium]
MKPRKGQLPILFFIVLSVIAFGFHFISKKDYEFVIYVGVIIFFSFIFIISNDKIYYPNGVLWALAIWALSHMAGGAIYLSGTRLYDLILIPISQNYPILRYDQAVHIFGFGAATVAVFYLLKPMLKNCTEHPAALAIVIICTGLGIGALNEIAEALVSTIVPRSGVGGYVNTSLDLVADIIGSILAYIVIRLTDKDFKIQSSD